MQVSIHIFIYNIVEALCPHSQYCKATNAPHLISLRHNDMGHIVAHTCKYCKSLYYNM